MNFEQYLNTQPIERVLEIRRAERAWVASKRPADNDQGWGNVERALGRAFEEQMCGYQDRPAGRNPKKFRDGFDY
jgi:hypothetical protein